MAGPIQSAIGQMLGSALGLVGASRKTYEENERQAAKKERDAQKEAAKNKNASSPDQVVAKTLKAAQDKKIESPKKYVFDENGQLLANYSEVASVMASQSLANALDAKARQKAKFDERKAAIAKRTAGGSK
jgi:hypothetical protein